MDMYSDNQFHTGLPVTLRITAAHGSINASSVERRASLAAFPRRAWERSVQRGGRKLGHLFQECFAVIRTFCVGLLLPSSNGSIGAAQLKQGHTKTTIPPR